MVQGYHSLVLHAHLPFVRHPESEGYIEERWLFEAITETYLPLLESLEHLAADQVPCRLTISLSPPLINMLTDPLLQNRFQKYLENLQRLAHKELIRTKGDPHPNWLAGIYQEKFSKMIKQYWAYEKNLLNGFRDLRDKGLLELITCCATHTFLPLFSNFPETVNAQVQLAVETHRQHLGDNTPGIWLPECGYYQGLDHILAKHKIRYFICDTHGVLHARPRPKYASYAPIISSAGVAAFPRDMESARQVWSAQEGYPGDYDYREYYRDIGYDLDWEYIKEHLPVENLRVNTGIKYHRITGKSNYKEWYNPEWAEGKTVEHARDFFANRRQQLSYASSLMDIPPLIVSPYDAELFGHWWYEGPRWLEHYVRQVAQQQDYQLATPGDYLAKGYTLQPAEPSPSSWGDGGYNQMWLDECNAWIYPFLHQYNRQLIQVAKNFQPKDSLQQRAINQAIRELLLAQSSDWAFIMKTGTMVEYAHKRTKNHLSWHHQLMEQLMEDRINEDFLSSLEQTNNIFPKLDHQLYSCL